MNKFLFYTLPFWVISLIYLLFSYIAMDFNPTHWELFTIPEGRLFTISLLILFIVRIIKFYDEIEL
jgi:hypothetical protein